MSPLDAHPERSGAPTPPGAAAAAAKPTGSPEGPATEPIELLEPGLRARIGRGLDRTPFRRKLNTLVVVPVVVISLLVGVIIAGQLSQAASTGDQAQLVRRSAEVALLNDDVRAEQQQAILLWTRYDLKGMSHSSAPISLNAYGAAQQATDAQVLVVSGAFGSAIPPAESQALDLVTNLDEVRSQITTGSMAADNIDSAYDSAAEALVDGLGLTSNRSGNITLSQTLDALLRADSAHAAYETGLLSAETDDSEALIEFVATVGDLNQYQYQEERFDELTDAAQNTALGGVDYNPWQSKLTDAYSVLEDEPSALTGDTATGVPQALLLYPTIAQEAAARQRTVQALAQQIASSADHDAADAGWRAALLLALALLVFTTWLTLSVLIRHSVVRPVQRLTSAARQVAEVSRQELARVADDDSQDESPPRLEAVPVFADDEIGTLAGAFNQVQVTAAGLLERQITSRRNIAEMFGNVGRRVSNLTTRQLSLIDAAERSETDPELLERLYRIDHIAVRMQRNADSLMLLAGIRETELDGRPAPVTHAVRAALGQIEGYQRVSLTAEADASVSPDALGDLVLMLAELLENAVSFSPAHSDVEVTVRSAPGGRAVVEIVDHGLGMGSDRLAEENARLVRRERLDLVPTKVLGLFVVGTLARRWGITVTLARTPGGGVTSTVTVPVELLAAAPAAPRPQAAAPAPAPAAIPVAAAAPEPVTASVAVTGPAPAPAAAPAPGGGLPRRAPRRPLDEPVHSHAAADSAPTDTARPAAEAPRAEAPRAEAPVAVAPAAPAPTAEPAPAAPTPGGLRRRVRGATLEGRPEAAPSAAAPRMVDAEAVRDSMEEFEEAVRRAELDSIQNDPRTPERPEGTGS
ncbi:ATP-binding protein [Streptacidiphilus sp. P02-A3a]|uniref:sensor histidine kinase n=1 Tax=Streptacidiphilus sp. P02-A3a TaxID=2704468 RepID=UPI0015FCDDE0|nr:ATP-binding protein [Streptacidiphilus sp. P02-A3a]QMU73182.1 sensor histidine kinase [Streptacidiphilus sp. P02-A3a]